jgi:hypothetical protein
VGPTENFPYLPMRPAPLPSHVAASPSPITRRRIPMDRRRPSSDAPLPAAARSTRSCQQLGNADLISFAPGLSPLLCSQRRSRGCGAAATRRDVSLALSSVHQRSCHGARDRPLPDQTTTAMDVIVNCWHKSHQLHSGEFLEHLEIKARREELELRSHTHTAELVLLLPVF